MANCDLTHRNDLDGRGNLSEESLSQFSIFFLETCIDQIDFMEQLMQPDMLRKRVLIWTREEIELGHLPSSSFKILEAILYRGEIAKYEIHNILNISERHARRLISELINKDILLMDAKKSMLKLGFPAKFADRWMPGLFPPN